MRWRMKALMQATFSNLPYGEKLNYVGQRYVLRNMPAPDDVLAKKLREARLHLDALTRHGTTPVDKACFYEFGAGRDLVIPLAFYSMGVNHQTVVDIRRMVRLDLVEDAARRIGQMPGDLLRAADVVASAGDASAQFASLGVRYRAPSDARATGLESDSVDYVTSTSTLEHIPPDDIRATLRECRRLLRPDGLMSLAIDYQDHYSYADPSITIYNFLQFEDSRWRLWSPSLQFQNRLRHVDYLKLLDEEGFEIVSDEPRAVGPDDLARLASLPSVASRFRDYTSEQLAVPDALIVVRPAK
ncbi:MAG: class I SAM-dependent methyltransferase [Acidimicrobiales bacterium]